MDKHLLQQYILRYVPKTNDFRLFLAYKIYQ